MFDEPGDRMLIDGSDEGDELLRREGHLGTRSQHGTKDLESIGDGSHIAQPRFVLRIGHTANLKSKSLDQGFDIGVNWTIHVDGLLDTQSVDKKL